MWDGSSASGRWVEKNGVQYNSSCLRSSKNYIWNNMPQEISGKKLKRICIGSTVLKYFGSYLSNRSTATIWGRCTSDKIVHGVGVPQGSILGQLLRLG